MNSMLARLGTTFDEGINRLFLPPKFDEVNHCKAWDSVRLRFNLGSDAREFQYSAYCKDQLETNTNESSIQNLSRRSCMFVYGSGTGTTPRRLSCATFETQSNDSSCYMARERCSGEGNTRQISTTAERMKQQCAHQDFYDDSSSSSTSDSSLIHKDICFKRSRLYCSPMKREKSFDDAKLKSVNVVPEFIYIDKNFSSTHQISFKDDDAL